jgi:uncharacterized membrane protein YcjF (UPF0283 family)
MNEENETIAAILQRLEKIEALLERMDRDNRKEEARNAAFDVKWEQLMKEHVMVMVSPTRSALKENWERINRLEQKPARDKAQLWDTFTGRALVLIGTAVGTAVITQIPSSWPCLSGAAGPWRRSVLSTSRSGGSM